jgi:uncharacterized protein YwgA
MNLRQLIVLTVKAFGGQIRSKMYIHKLMYFITNLLKIKDIDFEQTYFGPYSDQVDLALGELIGSGFISVIRNTEDENKDYRCTFILENSGTRLANSVKKSHPKEFNKIAEFKEKIVNIPMMTMALAAKTHFSLTSHKQSITESTIQNKIKSFDQVVTEEDVNNVIKILKEV